MSKVTKRWRQIQEKIKPGQVYGLTEAIALLQQCSKVKFKESFDIAIRLGVDPKKSEQVVRGAVVLPHGTGRQVKVAVFAQGETAQQALAAGADIVGFDDLAEKVKAGQIDFDVVIATPDSMRVVGQLGQILGPRGLMPNPKVGTVTKDVTLAVKQAKGGQVRYRMDKNGIVHCSVGQVAFESSALVGNVIALLQDVKKMKPSTAKGVYIKKISVSSTMGPGLTVDPSSIETA